MPGVQFIWHEVVLVPPLLLLLRVQWRDARLNPDAARAVCQGFTLDDDDGSSKQTLTMMISRSRTGTRCRINLKHVYQARRHKPAVNGYCEGRYGSSPLRKEYPASDNWNDYYISCMSRATMAVLCSDLLTAVASAVSSLRYPTCHGYDTLCISC